MRNLSNNKNLWQHKLKLFGNISRNFQVYFRGEILIIIFNESYILPPPQMHFSIRHPNLYPQQVFIFSCISPFFFFFYIFSFNVYIETKSSQRTFLPRIIEKQTFVSLAYICMNTWYIFIWNVGKIHYVWIYITLKIIIYNFMYHIMWYTIV